MSILLESFGIPAICILIGLGFLWIGGKIFTSLFDDTEYLILQSEISAAQLARRDERVKILYEIGKPECPDGTYSPRQMVLWKQYKELEKHNEEVTAIERSRLVEARR